MKALLALIAGLLPCAPGFLAIVGVMNATPFWTRLYHYAWFTSLRISFVVYLLRTVQVRPGARPAPGTN
jgi:nucleobase:cation symporter-1, NCS1 family